MSSVDYCESAENCSCPKNVKKSFFDEYKRFGIVVRIERDQLVIEDRRSASRVVKDLWIPLKTVAEIFAVKNVWQVLNSAVSGARNLANEKDLVRVYRIGRFSKDGETVLQLSVPKTGGLHMAIVVKRGKETLGLPTTVIKMLPVEVMMFLEMLPYYFLNRHHGNHAHWTALAAVACYKQWTDEALDYGDVSTLNRFLTALKEDKLKYVLLDLVAEGEDAVAKFDLETLSAERFRIADLVVDPDHFNEVLCNLLFELKFKIEGWQGTDDFSERAKVVPRQPPTVVENIVSHTFHATYDVGQYVLEQTVLGHSVESDPEYTNPKKRKEKNGTECTAKIAEKKPKLADDLLRDMALMFEEGDDFFEKSQVEEKVDEIILTLPSGPSTPPNEPELPPGVRKETSLTPMQCSDSQSPYIQCAQSQPEPPCEESKRKEYEFTIDRDHVRCLHIHIDDRQGSKVLTFDVQKQGVQIKFE